VVLLHVERQFFRLAGEHLGELEQQLCFRMLFTGPALALVLLEQAFAFLGSRIPV